MAASMGWEITHVFRDNDVSAWQRKKDKNGVLRVRRPAWNEVMAGLYAREFQGVIAYNLDRAIRDPRDLEDFIDMVKETGAVTKAVTGEIKVDTDDNIAMTRVLVAFANKSSADTSRRVKAAKLDMVQRGKYVGGPRRFGYNKDASELHPVESKILKEIYGRVAKGESISSVVRWCNENNICGTNGKPMCVSGLGTILRRRLNVGISEYMGEVVGTTISPRVIDEKTYFKAIALMDARKRPRGKPAKSLLGGFLVCGVCGHKLSRKKNTKNGVTSPITYVCGQNNCVNYKLEALDDYVGARVLDKIAENLAKVKAPVKITKATPAHEVEAAKWRGELADLQRMFAAGELSAKMFGPAAKAAEDKLAALEKLTVRATGKPATDALTKGKNIYSAWAAMDDEKRREVLREAIEKIIVGAGIKGDPFDMTHVEIVWK
jgi:DNA invertase Pin-like site-specific DNA recombinase